MIIPNIPDHWKSFSIRVQNGRPVLTESHSGMAHPLLYVILPPDYAGVVNSRKEKAGTTLAQWLSLWCGQIQPEPFVLDFSSSKTMSGHNCELTNRRASQRLNMQCATQFSLGLCMRGFPQRFLAQPGVRVAEKRSKCKQGGEFASSAFPAAFGSASVSSSY